VVYVAARLLNTGQYPGSGRRYRRARPTWG